MKPNTKTTLGHFVPERKQYFAAIRESTTAYTPLDVARDLPKPAPRRPNSDDAYRVPSLINGERHSPNHKLD